MSFEAETITWWCGACGQASELWVDPTAGSSQSYVEDCPHCCRPHRVRLSVDPETLEVEASVQYEG